MHGFMTRFIREEQGTAVVVIALAFTMLLGFAALAVDTGVLYLEHTRLARAADAAVLAGAQELPDTSRALTRALDYAQRNGADPSAINISFSPDNKKIILTTSKTVNLYFARALGFNTSTVNSRAVARISPIKNVKGLIPLGINEDLLPLSAGVEYMIKGGSQDGNPWRGIIEFPGQGNGGNNYRNLVINGYNASVQIDDLEGKVPGNKSGPTEQGIEDRISACTDGCTWNNYQPGCPRVILVPIYRDLGSQLTVVGFASVFLERLGNENGKGKDNRV
ncbi:MAG: pilus assembly protein TadG-related protein, partial [Eubacteriales bacterium]